MGLSSRCRHRVLPGSVPRRDHLRRVRGGNRVRSAFGWHQQAASGTRLHFRFLAALEECGLQVTHGTDVVVVHTRVPDLDHRPLPLDSATVKAADERAGGASGAEPRCRAHGPPVLCPLCLPGAPSFSHMRAATGVRAHGRQHARRKQYLRTVAADSVHVPSLPGVDGPCSGRSRPGSCWAGVVTAFSDLPSGQATRNVRMPAGRNRPRRHGNGQTCCLSARDPSSVAEHQPYEQYAPWTASPAARAVTEDSHHAQAVPLSHCKAENGQLPKSRTDGEADTMKRNRLLSLDVATLRPHLVSAMPAERERPQ